jgi:ribosomal protein S18 acetylase RimI-like enzyme
MMICRDAVLEDGPALGRVWVEAWRAAYAGLMPDAYLTGLDPTAALARFERALIAGRSFLVLEMDRAVVGFSRYGPSRDPEAGSQTGEVIAINLMPSCWRQRLGTALLKDTLLRLRLGGFTEATLWVLHGNTRARQFYEALGWCVDGAEKHDDTLTGFPLHEVRYRTQLSQWSHESTSRYRP